MTSSPGDLQELVHGLRPPPGGDTPYSEVYGKAPPEKGTFFKLKGQENALEK